MSWLAAGADFSLRDLGFGEALPSHVATYRSDIGLPHRDYSVSVGSDADTETDGIMSPEHAVRLWGRSNTKSGRSSCLSSRANSNLTLTDTEHENTENGRTLVSFTFTPALKSPDFIFFFHEDLNLLLRWNRFVCVCVCFKHDGAHQSRMSCFCKIMVRSYSCDVQLESKYSKDDLHLLPFSSF